jgi:septal ring factor EnvC (AmiA/AmiB activator)
MPPAEAARPGRGGRVLPVAGLVSREFGAAGEGGPSRGLTFQAPAGARVVSPCAGRIAFAAPFRSFGRLLIVDCGEGYHFVLGGLDRLDVSPGHKVLAGEPVGLLGGASSGTATADGGGRAALYVELRRRGEPVDPRPWFAARS